MPTEIHLIGESHYDIFKTARYLSAFEKLKPGCISLEIDSERAEALRNDAEVFIRGIGKSVDECRFVFGEKKFTAFIDSICSFIPSVTKYCLQHGSRIEYTDGKVSSVIKAVQDGLKKGLASIDSPRGVEKEHDFWEELFTTAEPLEIALLRALGESYLTKMRNERMPVEAIALFGISFKIISSPENELETLNRKLDSIYYSSSEDLCLDEPLNPEQRDQYAAKKILSLDGIVVHCGGLGHIFGDYKNLYSRLKKEGIPVTRHRLIDFDPRPDIKQYKDLVRQTAEKYVRLSSEIKKAREQKITPPSIFD